jgi:HK97 family phage major capsid protein
MNLNERIKALRSKRASLLKKSSDISDKATTEDRLFTDDEHKEFTAALEEVKQIDRDLEGLLAQERLLASAAVVLQQPGNDPNAAERIAPNPGGPDGTGRVEFRRFKAFPGQGFTRMVMAIAHSKGQMNVAANIARRWEREQPEIHAILEAQAKTGSKLTDVLGLQRAVVAAGTTTDPTWAQPLVWADNLVSEFIEFLRPQTIMGRLNLRPVPFNVRMPRQTTGALAQWVGEGQSKPVGKLDFDAITIPWAKMALIIVITQELARFSNPAAEMLVRDELIAAMAEFKDLQFIDPAIAPIAGIRPGSITHGLPPEVVIPSSGTTFAAINADVQNLLINMAANNMPMTRPVWIMSPAARIVLAGTRTAFDVPAYPTLGSPTAGTAGTFFGYPVIESNNMATVAGTPPTSSIILVDQAEIFYASDNGVDIETSTEASIQLDSAPATPPTPLVSFWQQNLVGVKAEEFNYWLRRRDYAVGMITGFPIVSPTGQAAAVAAATARESAA